MGGVWSRPVALSAGCQVFMHGIHAGEAKAGRPIAVPLNADAVNVLRGGKPRATVLALKTSAGMTGGTLGRPGMCNAARVFKSRWNLAAGPTQEMVLRYAHLAADHLLRRRAGSMARFRHSEQKLSISTRRSGSNNLFAIKVLKMVAKDGIEPPTRGFSIPCSTD